MADLVDPKWMYLKAVLFAVVVQSCGGLLFTEAPSWRTALLLLLLAWAAARLYYFLFYVLERYVDPSLRYSGLISLLCHVWEKRGQSSSSQG